MSDTAIGYVRVSTQEQVQEGVSIAAQEESIRAYCTMRGLKLVDLIVDEGVSAHKALSKRKGGVQVIDAANKKRAGAVIAYKLDRLFRNCADCLKVIEGWEKTGTALHLIDMGGSSVDTSSAMGKFFITVMAGAAELERNQIAERTSSALQYKKSQGQFTGGRRAPYGYDLAEDGVTLVPNQGEQRVMELIRSLRDKGLSLRKIGSELERRGYMTRNGSKWDAKQIQRIAA